VVVEFILVHGNRRDRGNVRTGFFELDEFQSVLNHMPEDTRNMIRFFYITGWRDSEVRNLQWRQVDFENGWVYLTFGTTKNKKGRQFPLTAKLRQLLQEQRAYTRQIERDNDMICPWVLHRQGRYIKSYRGAWAKACKKAGLVGRRPHDFRRPAGIS
jgi:integrase